MSGFSLQDKVQWLPDSTTALAMCWVTLIVYGLALAFASQIHISPVEWLAIWTMLAVAWSVMERKRWGRFAMIGIAIVLLVNLFLTFWRLQSIPPSLIQPALIGKFGPTMVVHAFLRSTLFGSSSLLLAPITTLWLMRQKVKAEFEHCKPLTTRRHQMYIAVFLVSVCVFGIVEDSASGWTNALIQSRAGQNQPLLLTRVPRAVKSRLGPMHQPQTHEHRKS